MSKAVSDTPDYKNVGRTAPQIQNFNGDSIIAATAQTLKAPCVTDDQHIKNIKEIKTKWIL
jgi:predicted nucleic acid-binding protein